MAHQSCLQLHALDIQPTEGNLGTRARKELCCAAIPSWVSMVADLAREQAARAAKEGKLSGVTRLAGGETSLTSSQDA